MIRPSPFGYDAKSEECLLVLRDEEDHSLESLCDEVAFRCGKETSRVQFRAARIRHAIDLAAASALVAKIWPTDENLEQGRAAVAHITYAIENLLCDWATETADLINNQTTRKP